MVGFTWLVKVLYRPANRLIGAPLPLVRCLPWIQFKSICMVFVISGFQALIVVKIFSKAGEDTRLQWRKLEDN
jgi:hypothetical protein